MKKINDVKNSSVFLRDMKEIEIQHTTTIISNHFFGAVFPTTTLSLSLFTFTSPRINNDIYETKQNTENVNLFDL
jgi:hypothetical protein